MQRYRGKASSSLPRSQVGISKDGVGADKEPASIVSLVGARISAFASHTYWQSRERLARISSHRRPSHDPDSPGGAVEVVSDGFAMASRDYGFDSGPKSVATLPQVASTATMESVEVPSYERLSEPIEVIKDDADDVGDLPFQRRQYW